MKVYKISLFIFLLVLMLVVSSCSSNSDSNNSAPAPTNATNESDQTKEGDIESDKELYVIKSFVRADIASELQYFSETPIGKIVKDKFNMDFEFVAYPPGGDIQQTWNLMLAGGNYPEIVYTNCNCLPEFNAYLNAGVVLPLDPYLDNMPNFKELYKENIPYWKHAAKSTGDGKLYNWNVWAPQDSENVLEANDILVRSDILEWAGYPELLTPDDYVKLFGDFIKENPMTNGVPNLGLSAPWAEEWGIGGLAPILYEKGDFVQVANRGVIYNAVEEKWYDMFTHPYVKESFQFFNRLYQAGALDTEALTDNMSQHEEKVQSGRAIASWYTVWFQGNANRAMEVAETPELSYIALPILGQGSIDNGEKRTTPLYITRPFEWVFMTNAAKHPDRIMELLDWSSTDEAQILLQSGIEGVHYEIVDGKRVPTEYYYNPENIENFAIKEGLGIGRVLGLSHAAINSPSDDQPYNMSLFPEVKKLQLTEREIEVYDKMGWESNLDWWIKNATGKVTGLAGGLSVDPASEFGSLEQRLTEFRVKNTPRLFMAANDEEFENIYQELVTEYERMDPYRLVDEYNRLYDESKTEFNNFR